MKDGQCSVILELIANNDNGLLYPINYSWLNVKNKNVKYRSHFKALKIKTLK